MKKRKVVIGGAVTVGIIAVIGFMYFAKNGMRDETSGAVPHSATPVLNDQPAENASEPDAITNPVHADSVGSSKSITKATEDNTLLNGDLTITGPFDLAELRSAGVPVIIDFGADSCIPCKEMAPILVALHDELKGKAIIRFVDVWKYRDLAEGFPLRVIPTQFFFDSSGKPFTPSEKPQIAMTQYSKRNTNEHVFTTHEGGITKDQLLAVLDEMGMKR